MRTRQHEHGHARRRMESPTYVTWRLMRDRCNNPNHENYHLYGGRGITVCDEWENFSVFLEDMGERPEGKTLDRLDNDGKYCKDNCKWATKQEQGRNRSTNVLNINKAASIALSKLYGEGSASIARRMNLGSTTVSNVTSGRYWKDATEIATRIYTDSLTARNTSTADGEGSR